MDLSQEPQVNQSTIIRVQQQEINRLNDNRVYLMTVLEEIKTEALAELAARDSEIAGLKAKLEGAEAQPNGRVKT